MSERASECLYLNMGYHSVPLANNLWALELAIGHTLRPVENPARALQGFWILLQLHFRSDSNKIKQTNKSIEKISHLVTCLLWRKKEAHDHLQHAFHLSECYFVHQVLNMIMLVYHVNFSDYFNQIIAIQLEETKKKTWQHMQKGSLTQEVTNFPLGIKEFRKWLKKREKPYPNLFQTYFQCPGQVIFPTLCTLTVSPNNIQQKRPYLKIKETYKGTNVFNRYGYHTYSLEDK